MDNYDMSPEILREEPHGRLYKATFKPTGETVVIKKIPSNANFPNGLPPALSREILIYQKLPKSAYVIDRRHVFRQFEDGGPVFYIVYEHLDTDLAAFIAASSVSPLPSDLVKKLLFQLLKGVDHCHRNGVLHRNLNPKNLLLDEKQQSLKIGDGISQSFAFCYDNFVPETVTLSYQAPEVLLGSTDFSTPADIWAVGCIFAEMVTGDVLFVGIGDDPNQADKQQLREIFRQLGKPMLNQCPGLTSLPAWETYQEWEGEKMKARFYSAGDLPSDLLVATVSLEQDGAELLSKMLAFDPDERITAKAALNHPYFKQMDI
ncbi:putative protein-serine/threonine kinase CMGC-CDK-Pl family [Rosa chinensis]|uniref:cyclin-dependent kinase n=2 Tax=Rosa chinensis TaxID=74649 RepID=A0A2P6PT25_ROSCH|nr:putative protein-serine/threonine kinase CMGC-CDK-Pl family [Rosa chinensis]